MVIMGALAHLVNMPHEYLEEFVEQRFNRGRPGDDEIIRSNIQGLGSGPRAHSEQRSSVGRSGPAQKPEYEQLMIKGNEALSLGAIAGGLDYYVGYPISPATPILLYMERNLVGRDRFAYQVSSEIESITSILGAGYAGKRAMTATAGPGVSLMSEGTGPELGRRDSLGGGRRPAGRPSHRTAHQDRAVGPDELHVPGPRRRSHPHNRRRRRPRVFLRRGESHRVGREIPGARNIDERNVLGGAAQNIPAPDLSQVEPAKRIVYQGSNGYKRYAGTELSPCPFPAVRAPMSPTAASMTI